MNENRVIKKLIPQSHGAWGFVLEPLTLALWIAWSFDGLMLFLGAIFAFLAHQPIRLLIINGFQKMIFLFSLIFIGVSSYFLSYFFLNTSFLVYWPLLLALSLMLIFLVIDLSGESKSLLVEIIVPLSLSLMAVSIFLVKEQSPFYAFAFFGVLLSRSVTTVFYVRAQIRILKKKQYSNNTVVISHTISLVYVLIMIHFNYIPTGIVIAVIILFLRYLILLYPMKNRLSIKQIGILEFIFGFLFVGLSGIAYIFAGF